jgi:sulfotransferase family protein
VPHGPIFIIGAMGSGTTLLRLMLDSHPNIAIPGETGFMRAYNAHQFIPFKWSGRNWAKRLGWSREELDRELAAFYERLFQRYLETHGKQRWGEKTPLHTFHVDDMARLYPEAAFVMIVRHPGGEVASTMSRFNHSFGRATQHYDRYTRECVRQAAHHADRSVLLRYEDLVLHPEAMLRELLDWLGEPWSDQVLAHHTVQSGRGGRSIVEGGNRADDPIDTTRITKWTTTLVGPARAKVQRRLGRLGEFLGYSMADAAALEPLGATLLARGAEIDARIDRYADLDLRTQVQVPPAERFYHPRDFVLTRRAEPKKAVIRSPGAAPEPPPPKPARTPIARRVPAAVRRRTPAPIKRRLRAAAGRLAATRG